MNKTNTAEVLAGQLKSTCECCPTGSLLVSHIQLGASRMFCPVSRATYLDRGDGVFQRDGGTMEVPPPAAEAAVPPPGALDVLSDRPARSPEKVRISLERATFA